MKKFELIDQSLRVYYHTPNGHVVDCGVTRWDEPWYEAWLMSMVEKNDDVIFFLVAETTDVFEPEIDYNTVVYRVDNETFYHTFSPWCPEGCHGQLPDCTYKGPDH